MDTLYCCLKIDLFRVTDCVFQLEANLQLYWIPTAYLLYAKYLRATFMVGFLISAMYKSSKVNKDEICWCADFYGRQLPQSHGHSLVLNIHPYYCNGTTQILEDAAHSSQMKKIQAATYTLHTPILPANSSPE